MRIAITGSKGFIGSNLLPVIQEQNDICELDITNGYDLSDKSIIEKVDKFDLIIHLAAKSYVPESYKNSLDFYHTNINSTLNVLELCKKYKARIIYISSYVYGKPDYLPIDEKHPVKPFNPYSQSKIISESLVSAYSRDFELDAIVLRPFNIYGFGQNGDFLIPSIINQFKSGTVKLKDPRPKRDFLYIKDLCDLLNKLVNYNNKGVEVFNVGSGISYSISEIVKIIEKLSSGNKVQTIFSNEYRKEEILDVVADITKIKNCISWIPQYTLADGLESYLAKVR